MAITIEDLNNRSLEVFKELVDTYIETGEPVGSRTISKKLRNPLSPASVRNIMADLEELGFLYAPHTSSGRLPTSEALQLFVNGLLEVGTVDEETMDCIEKSCGNTGKNINECLEQFTQVLSGISNCAGLVTAPKHDGALKHIDFIQLSNERVLVILVSDSGLVENRLIDIPEKVSVTSLAQAARYLNTKLNGKSLREAKLIIEEELKQHRDNLDDITKKIIKAGIAVWSNDQKGALIIKGQSNLLSKVNEISDIEHVRKLFKMLETKEAIQSLLEESIIADGVQIFVGSENEFFSTCGCSIVASPYFCNSKKVVGIIGVIGPSRMNYGKIIPLVDYTAKIISKIIE